jgi:predicted dehydrogenase
MKFLIAGFGSIGRRHFRNLLELGEREIIFYRTGQSTLPEKELDGYQIETDLQAALSHQPDAVIVSNPTSCHLDVALPAADMGCHLLIEKPVSHTMDRIKELEKLVAKSSSKVLVGFQFRFHPNLIQIKKLLQNDEIGRTLAVRAHWGEYLPDWHPWEDYRTSYSARKDLGGGVLLTLCHSFDYLHWLFGSPRVLWSVLGHSSDLEIDVEDTAEVGLLFDKTVIGNLHLNYVQIPNKHTLEIIGTRGSIFWDYYQNTVNQYNQDGSGEILKVTHLCPPEFERNHLFLEEMKHFIDVIKGNAEPICSLQEGVIALQLALQAKSKGSI